MYCGNSGTADTFPTCHSPLWYVSVPSPPPETQHSAPLSKVQPFHTPYLFNINPPPFLQCLQAMHYNMGLQENLLFFIFTEFSLLLFVSLRKVTKTFDKYAKLRIFLSTYLFLNLFFVIIYKSQNCQQQTSQVTKLSVTKLN